MMGTNPLVFGIPTDEEFPFTNDYATSIIQRGKIEQYVRERKLCPEGLVINWDGKTETDPQTILDDLIKGRSAFTPVGGLSEETGGHKGYGFATVVEILSAALQQGASETTQRRRCSRPHGAVRPGAFLYGRRH